MKNCIILGLILILFHLYAFAEEVLLASIKVNGPPLPGQTWRASDNFSLSIPNGASYIIFKFTGATSVSVARDLEDWEDDVWLQNIVNGSTANTEDVNEQKKGSGHPFRGFYFGDSKDANGPYTVTIYAVFH